VKAALPKHSVAHAPDNPIRSQPLEAGVFGIRFCEWGLIGYRLSDARLATTRWSRANLDSVLREAPAFAVALLGPPLSRAINPQTFALGKGLGVHVRGGSRAQLGEYRNCGIDLNRWQRRLKRIGSGRRATLAEGRHRFIGGDFALARGACRPAALRFRCPRRVGTSR